MGQGSASTTTSIFNFMISLIVLGMNLYFYVREDQPKNSNTQEFDVGGRKMFVGRTGRIYSEKNYDQKLGSLHNGFRIFLSYILAWNAICLLLLLVGLKRGDSTGSNCMLVFNIILRGLGVISIMLYGPATHFTYLSINGVFSLGPTSETVWIVCFAIAELIIVFLGFLEIAILLVERKGIINTWRSFAGVPEDEVEEPEDDDEFNAVQGFPNRGYRGGGYGDPPAPSNSPDAEP